MTLKYRILNVLLHLYPTAWRAEYGEEFADMLLRDPLSAGVIVNVVCNGLRQRIRAAEPSTLLGLPVMLLVLAGLVWDLASADRPPVLLADSSKTLPVVIVKPFDSGPYALLLLVCGCWTYLRRPGGVSRCGIAGMRMTFLAGIPIMLAGVLMIFGLPEAAFLGVRRAPTPLTVFAATLFALPKAWIWGALGAYLGRRISLRWQTPLSGR
jgi:hypothetical protein